MTKLTPVPSKAPTPAQEFHQFRTLPAEVRLQIWEQSLPGPRIVVTRGYGAGEKGQGLRFHLEDNDGGNPGVLGACVEARDVALKRYAPSWGTSGVYADLKKDVLWCDGSLEARAEEVVTGQTRR